MVTVEQLNLLIDQAAAIAGNQVKLANLIGIPKNHITEMKKGRRPCNWRTRGKLRAILGENPAHAFMAAMAEDLEQSENPDEKKGADGFKTMLAAFPHTGGNGRIRTLDKNLPQTRVTGSPCTVYGTLHHRFRHLKQLRQRKHGVFTGHVQPDNLSFSL